MFLKLKKLLNCGRKNKTKSIIVDGEEKLIPGSSDKNITYMQILLKPNDLDLNLKYAQQQGKLEIINKLLRLWKD